MSLIVVEGVDASGKSTLLENARIAIKKRYFVIARHSCRPLEEWHVLNFLNMVEDYRPILDIVIDRHPLISEPIYGPILRGSNLIDGIEDEKSATQRLKATVKRIVYCRPPNNRIEECLHKQPQLAGVEAKLFSLLEAYDRRMGELEVAGIPIYWYSYVSDATDLETVLFGDQK